MRKGKYLEVSGDRITLKAAQHLQNFFSTQLKMGENDLFEGKKLIVSLVNQEKYKFFANNDEEDLKNVFDYDKINSILMIRQKMPGDAIQLEGMNSPRSFKKLLNQRKVSLEDRSRLAVISDEKGPLWLEGFGVRQDVLPDDKSKRIMMIRVLEE